MNHHRWQPGRARPASALLLGAAWLCLALPAQAHPGASDTIQHQIQLRIDRENIDLHIDLLFSGKRSEAERRQMDRDGDGRLTREEIEEYAAQIEAKLSNAIGLRCDGRRLEVAPLFRPTVELGEWPSGDGQQPSATGGRQPEGGDRQPATANRQSKDGASLLNSESSILNSTAGRPVTLSHRLRLTCFARTPAGLKPGSELEIEDGLWPEIPAVHALFVRGEDGYRVRTAPVQERSTPEEAERLDSTPLATTPLATTQPAGRPVAETQPAAMKPTVLRARIEEVGEAISAAARLLPAPMEQAAGGEPVSPGAIRAQESANGPRPAASAAPACCEKLLQPARSMFERLRGLVLPAILGLICAGLLMAAGLRPRPGIRLHREETT